MLAWWREREDERLRRGGRPHALDAAAQLFGDDVRVVRDPAFGVAPWNERALEGARTAAQRPRSRATRTYAARLRAARLAAAASPTSPRR